MLKLKNTRKGLLRREWPTGLSRELQFLQMSKTSKVKLATVKLFTEDFLAKTSALQAMELAWRGSEVDFSTKLSGLQKKFDRVLSSLKMCQQLELEDWSKLSKHLPKFGMTVDGRVYLPQALEPTISAKDGLCWQTPTVQDFVRTHHNQTNGSVILSLLGQIRMWPTPNSTPAGNNRGGGAGRIGKVRPTIWTVHGGKLNPMWVEWLMSVPLGWTELKPLEMESCHSKQEQLLKD